VSGPSLWHDGEREENRQVIAHILPLLEDEEKEINFEREQ